MEKQIYGEDKLARFGVFLEHVAQIYDLNRRKEAIDDIPAAPVVHGRVR